MNRALALAAALAVLGCSRIDVSVARKYQCDPAGDSAQCPGGWRCTLDGFCANPDAGLDLSCDTSADCTGGWLCAATQRCVDPKVGRPLPCDVDEECPGGWKCGLINQCLDPDAGAPWPCQRQEDCTGGWHCGVRDVCYDRAVAEDVECRRDAGVDDCRPGWRCGFEDVCHDRAVGAALRCAVDDDCEQGWRCDATGRCVDASLDTLRSTDDAGVATAAPLPSFVPQDVELTSVSRSFFQGGAWRRFAAFVADGGITVARFNDARAEGDTNPLGLVARAAAPSLARALTFTLEPLPSLPPDLWVAGGSSLVKYTFSAPDQLVADPPVILTFQPTHLRALEGGSITAFDDLSLHVRLIDGGVQTVILARDGGVITDTSVVEGAVFTAPSTVAPQPRSLLVLTTRGSFASPWGSDLSLWTQVELDQTSQLTPERIVSFDTLRPALVAGHRGAGNVGVSALTPITRDPSANRLVDPLNPGQMLVTSLPTQPTQCSAQPAAFMAAQQQDGGAAWVLHCRQPDGGVDVELNQYGFGNETLARLPRGSAFGEDNPREYIRAERGAAWVRSTFPGDFFVVPITPGESTALTGRASDPVVQTPARGFDGCTLAINCPEFVRTTACVHGNTAWLWCAFETGASRPPSTRIVGRPSWELFDFRAFAGLPPFGVFTIKPQHGSVDRLVATSSIDFVSPGAAAAQATGDGGTMILVGGRDGLYWGEATTPRDGGNVTTDLLEPPTFRFGTVPQPGAQISSIAPLPVDSVAQGARFAEGFLVASGRAYRYAADNEVVWRAEELPISAAEAIAVWADGRRGRVVYRDGAVYGLPSRVLLADALTPAATSVFAAEAFCGHTFVLSSTGLYQLVTQAQGLARWRPIELGLPAPALAGGRLLAEEDSLLVLLTGGDSRVVSGFSCLD